MDLILDTLTPLLPISRENLYRILLTLFIIIILRLLAWFSKKTAERRISDIHRLYNWRKATSITAHIIGLLMIGHIWFAEFRQLLTIIGIVSVGLAIAFKETLMNVTGGLFILRRNIFSEGDRIQIGPHQGDVIGFGVFYFTLMEVGDWVGSEQSTGRVIKVPNSMVITTPIINYNRSFPYIWNEIGVKITPDSNRHKAETLLLEIAGKVSVPSKESARKCLRRKSDEVIIFKHLEPAVYIAVQTQRPAGFILTLRYLCEPRQRRDTEKRIWNTILDEFANHKDITIAYDLA